jgi:hypothetical protein
VNSEQVEQSESIAAQVAKFRAILLKQRSRYLRWAIVCAVFFILVTVAALLAESVTFAIVAGYFAFFAWDRCMQWQRTTRWLSRSLGGNDETLLNWALNVSRESSQPPTWEKISHWVAGLTAFGLAVMQTTVVWMTAGFWMKSLYAFGWVVVMLVLIWRRMGMCVYTARAVNDREQDQAPGPMASDSWHDVT